MPKARLALFAVLAGALSACEGRGDSDPRDDGGPDTSVATEAVVCSVPLTPPCHTSVLDSDDGCPETMPTEGTGCALSAADACYYCAGESGTWTSQGMRPTAYCENGAWKTSIVACGAGP